MTSFWITAIGLMAQGLFSARLIVQWLKSEKEGKVVSPTIFWQLSLCASFLLIIYGVLRNDIIIIAGQAFGYFIYIRNLRFKHAWHYLPHWFKYLVIIAPVAGTAYLLGNSQFHFHQLVENPAIPLSLMIWGTVGQVIFTFRFVYQWIYSEREKVSILPAGFWVISLVGSLFIIVYGIIRCDIVLITGQIFGVFIYSRNLILISKNQTVKQY